MVLHGDVFGAAELQRFTEPWKGLGSEMLRSLTHDAGFILEILARVYMRFLLTLVSAWLRVLGFLWKTTT